MGTGTPRIRRAVAGATVDYVSGSRQPVLPSPGPAGPSDASDGVVGYFADQTPEGPGRWVGSGARTFGLEGVVGRDDLEALLRGADPRSGAELIPTLQLGRNSNDYRLGDRYQASIWCSRQLTPALNLWTRATGESWQNVRGADPALDRADEPTKDPALQGGRRLDLALGLTYRPPEGILEGQQFFVEVAKPVAESLNGPQLGRRFVVSLGWRLEF